MPDPTFDDPFADLFGKLPDPRSRGRAVTPESSGGSSEDAAEPPVTPPVSRREAREAAAREAAATAATPVVPAASGAVPVPPTAEEPVAPATPAESISAQPEPIPAQPEPVSAAAPIEPAPAPRPASAVPASGPDIVPEPEAVRARESVPAGPRRGAAPAASPGLEDLFAGNTTTDSVGAVPPPPDKKKRRIGGWIALAVVVVILGGLTAGGFYVWNTYEDRIRAFMGWEEPADYEAGLANGEAILTVVSGDTGASISPKLFEAGVTKTEDAFYDYLIEEALNPVFQPGVFRLQRQMTSAAALEAIQNPENRMENTAQLREGLTVEQSIQILADSLQLPIEDFQAAVADPAAYGVGAASLEGWLFPATYTFGPDVTAPDAIKRLVDETVSRLDAAGVAAEDRQRILIIASIIQREARYEADMQKVATVIENRLDPSNQETFGLLQMDSTAQYGYGEMHAGTASSSAEALADDNLWNTYVHAGLPVGPISNPGDMAIAAALNPAEGDWLYFVTVNLDTGETVFTSTNADHNRAVEQWRAWCRDNPDSGC